MSALYALLSHNRNVGIPISLYGYFPLYPVLRRAVKNVALIRQRFKIKVENTGIKNVSPGPVFHEDNEFSSSDRLEVSDGNCRAKVRREREERESAKNEKGARLKEHRPFSDN